MRRILAIFAHPDDEIGAGSTLAWYSDAGVHTTLVCATRGEAATIYCDECATRENLAEVRTHELECACQHLGIAELRWLDWPDGGIGELSRAEAVSQVVALIRELQPVVIITHPENGLYPHPDHLAVWEIVREAFHSAEGPAEGVRAESPEAGAPWATARLFTRALPQSFFDAVPAFREYRVHLKGQQLPFVGTPDDEIDVVTRVAPWAQRRLLAWDCHRSQHNPEGAFSQMPDEFRRSMAENEHFVLAEARIPMPEGVADDLLAGLESAEGDLHAAPGHQELLRNALSEHRSYLDSVHTMQQPKVPPKGSGRSPEPGWRVTLGDVAEREQEIIYRLAHALRLAEGPAQGVGRDEVAGRGAPATDARLLEETALRDAEVALNVLLSCFGASMERYTTYSERQPNADAREFWREMHDLVAAQVSALNHFKDDR